MSDCGVITEAYAQSFVYDIVEKSILAALSTKTCQKRIKDKDKTPVISLGTKHLDYALRTEGINLAFNAPKQTRRRRKPVEKKPQEE